MDEHSSLFWGDKRKTKCEVCHVFYDFEIIQAPEIKYNNAKMFVDILIPIMFIHMCGFLFGILITLNGTVGIYVNNIPLYVYLFGNIVLHFIVGIILICYGCCCIGIISLVGLVYLFIIVYEDAYKKAKERQRRFQTIRIVKDRSVPEV
jgi:hypothetical protein